MNKKVNNKANYLDIELIVNQRVDKFVGVGFGHSLEGTIRKIKERVENPPKVNMVVPVVVGDKSVVKWGFNYNGTFWGYSLQCLPYV